MNRLCTEVYGYRFSKKLGLSFDETDYLMDTQNLLMEEAFEQDFEKIQNLDDAKTFFEKLRNFETVRTKVAIEDNKTHKINIDNSYKEFYQKKLQEMAHLLEERGVSKEKIEKELLNDYQYQQQQFKPCFTEEEQLQ